MGVGDGDFKERLSSLIDAMSDGAGSQAESFFEVQGLGDAYASPGRYESKRKRVNAAIRAARTRGDLEAIVDAGRLAYGLGEPEVTKAPTEVAPIRTSTNKGSTRLSGSQSNMLFVSHATADKALAEALVTALRLGTNLTAPSIRCTSLEGMGVPRGDRNYSEHLRSTLAGAALVLPLLTPAFFDSDMCLVELGALWVLDDLPAFPLLVKPIDYARVEQLLGKWQGAKIEDKNGLNDLRDKVEETLELTRASTAMWERQRDAFLQQLPEITAGLATASRIALSEHQDVKDRAVTLEAEVERLAAERDDLKAKLTAVSALKDAKEVAPLLVNEDEQSRFDALVTDAQRALSGLSRTVQMAIYEELAQGSGLYVEPYDDIARDEVQAAVRAGQLNFDEDEGLYTLGRDDEVDAATSAVRQVFDEEWSAELHERFQADTRKDLEIRLKPVWEYLGLL